MLGRSHAILGLASTAVTLTAAGTHIFQNTPVFMAGLTVGMIAALLPDIDSADTYLRRTFRLGSRQTVRDLRTWYRKRPLALLMALARWGLARVFDLIGYLLPHRGPTHYGLTAVLLTALVYWGCQSLALPWEIWVAFGAGYFSHLLGDGVTKTGVRLYAPLYRPFVHFLPEPLCIVTGSWQEAVMLFTLITGLIAALFIFGTVS